MYKVRKMCCSMSGTSAAYELAALAGQNEPEEFKKLGGMECVECGCCSYVCPAKRQVTQSVRSMKKLIIASARKK